MPYALASNTLAIDGDAQLADNGKIIHTKLAVVPSAFDSAISINEDTGQLTLVDMLDYETVRLVLCTLLLYTIVITYRLLRIIFLISDIALL